mgnify:CR=1 FL=1
MTTEIKKTNCHYCGYLCAFTVQNDQVRKGDNPYKLPRVRMFGSSALEGFEYQVQHGIG